MVVTRDMSRRRFGSAGHAATCRHYALTKDYIIVLCNYFVRNDEKIVRILELKKGLADRTQMRRWILSTSLWLQTLAPALHRIGESLVSDPIPSPISRVE